MKEEFLHYLWKYKKFDATALQTTSGEAIDLIKVGQHNLLAGPDFFNASIYIDEQLWAGNVEIHLKSSDWYAHGHETDVAYDSVIVHVVWEHDVNVYRKDNTPIPTLELKEFVSKEALHNYQYLFANQKERWVSCEKDISNVPEMIFSNWMERLYFERLAQKTALIDPLLKHTKGDWEAVFFILLMRSFGTKINGDAFQSIAQHIDYSIVRKCFQSPFGLEALLLGSANLLPEETIDSYALQLQSEYDFMVTKFDLQITGILPVQFYKLRPDNFPTIRLSQVAQLYHKHQQLFHKMMNAQSLEQVYILFDIQASAYWDTHYNFNKEQKKRPKKLTNSFIDLIIINTIIPLRFMYSKHLGRDENEVILNLMQEIKAEKNTIINKFSSFNLKINNAQESQSLLQLKSKYCDNYKCLSCAVGNYVMGR